MAPASWVHHHHHPPPTTPIRRRYNNGAYAAIGWPGQINNAIGQDTGTFVDPDGNTQSYALTRIPGGHLGTATYPGMGALNPAVDGPGSAGVRGFVVPYYWNELETSKGNYVFHSLDADVNVCIALGLQIIVMIIERTFNNSNNPAPGIAGGGTDDIRYLNQLPYVVNYTLSGGGWQMSRWNNSGQNVQARYALLTQQIKNRWASCPNFEGIATQETSGGLTPAEQTNTGFTSNGFYAGLQFEVDTLQSQSNVWRHFGYANFMPQDSGTNQAAADLLIDNYFQYMAASGCSVGGGPDILPDNAGLQNRVYPHYANVVANAYPNNGPLFCSAQDATFSQTIRTMLALQKWCTNLPIGAPALPGGGITNLFLDYMFYNWELNNIPLNFNPDARLVIANRPDFHTYNPP